MNIVIGGNNPPEKSSRAEERKQNREKNKAIKAGTYEETPLERAKEAIRAMADPSLEALAGMEEFKPLLDDETSKKLKIFVQN